MTYGANAVIPLETGFPTTRTSSFNPKDNDEQLTRSLDLIEEKRENAMVQLAHYQQNGVAKGIPCGMGGKRNSLQNGVIDWWKVVRS